MYRAQILNIHDVNGIIGKFIRHERKRKGLSGEDLSVLIGISQQQISRYERGKCKITVEMMLLILNKLNIPLGEFSKFIIDYFGGKELADAQKSNYQSLSGITREDYFINQPLK